ncbi:MAG: flavin reductase family protein [Salibacteraceae bacterium]
MRPPLKMVDRETLESWERRYRGNFVNSLSGFKSLNLCGTVNDAGQTNLSVISSVVHLGAHPPLMGMIVRPDTVPRHTLSNLEATGYYTFNHLTEEMVRQGHQSAANYPENDSEFEATGLTPVYDPNFKAPYVEESQIRIGLAFRERHNLSINGTILIIGEIQQVWFPETCHAADGYLDIQAAGTVTVAGLDAYHSTNKLARFSYAKPDKELTEIPGFIHP